MTTTKASTAYISLSGPHAALVDALRGKSRELLHEDPPLHYAIGQLLEANLVEIHRLANRLVDANLVSCQSAGIEVGLTLAKLVQYLKRELAA